MVITRIQGGLGNQMFQYAVGKAAAIHYGVQLKLDVEFFKTQSLRDYELSIFDLEEHFVTESDKRAINGFHFPRLRRLQSKMSAVVPLPKIRRLNDSQCGFDPKIFSFDTIDRKGLYLDGFWQSPKYFSSIEQTIRSEFDFKYPLDAANQNVIAEIDECNSVCLHVRRGDYVTNSSTNALHGTCDLDYYNQAVSVIGNKVENPKFFVFSDDPGWSQSNIKIPHPTRYVVHNVGKKNSEDLRLMKACRNFVIANSSFSWWGAWLSSYVGKVVIAPQRWFVGQDRFSSDLIPSDWIRI